MKKLGKKARAVLEDMMLPSPNGRYFAQRGKSPERGKVFKIEMHGQTIVFARDKARLLSPEILAQVPHVAPQTLWMKTGWYAGWYYLLGRSKPEANDDGSEDC